MAPESTLSKRKRSRPSNFWVVPTANALDSPRREPSPKRPGRGSTFGHDTPAAANRGKRRRITSLQDVENAKENGEAEIQKSLRRGRSSNTEVEVEAVAAAGLASEIEFASKRRPGRPASKNKVEDKSSSLEGSNLIRTTNLQMAATSTASHHLPQKKRGRPVSTMQENDELANEIAETAEGVRQRGRGRRGNPVILQELKEPTDNSDKDLLVEKNPARPSSVSMGKEEVDTPLHQGASTQIHTAAKRRHGKLRSNSRVETQRGVDEAAVVLKPLRRGRSSNTQTEVQAVVESATRETLPKKSSRKVAVTETQSSAAGDARINGGNRRSRRSDTVLEIETAISSFGKNRNTTKSVGNNVGSTNLKAKKTLPTSNDSSRTKEQQLPVKDVQPDREPHGKRKRRKSIVDSKRKQTEVEVEVPKVKRPRVEKSPIEGDYQADEAPTYQHLAPVIRKISRQTIQSKWEPLAPAGIERISNLLADVQRSVTVRLNDEKRKKANLALRMISGRLSKRLSKGQTFPPPTRSTREDDLDFEKILDHNRILEAKLTPILHSNKLLEAEVAKQLTYLETEQASLADLEANAKSETTVRKDAGRKLHPLLHSESIMEADAAESHIGLLDGHQSVMPFSHTDDEDLQNVAKELNGHLDTIQSNINKVEGISEAMTKSRAALQATLFEHLDGSEYDDLILG